MKNMNLNILIEEKWKIVKFKQPIKDEQVVEESSSSIRL